MNKIQVIDFINTGKGAERLLFSRVKMVHNDIRFNNSIICPEGEEAHRIAEAGVPVLTMKISRELGIFNIICEFVELYKIIKNNSPHIIHTHTSKAGALGRIVCWYINLFRKKKIYIIHQVHGYYFFRLKGFKRKIFYWIEKMLAFITDALLFQNKYEYELSMKFKPKKTKFHMIKNGINFDHFSGISGSRDNDVKIIICVARIEPVKNHKMLLEVANLLRTQYQYNKFIIYIIGEGEYQYLEKIVTQYNLSENVVFTGKLQRKEVAEYLEIADISVLTSINEGMPRSLMESMYYSIPCIGTNVIGTNEVIVDNYNGYLVELNDCEKFAEKMYCLLTNDDIRKELGTNAKKHCLENFNEDKTIEIIKDIYINAMTERESK
ncbi:MAG: glycosyltransferase [Spirochaetes bacterium]|nr:glycosyltransferase [Spirochaetota bacterium]